jgi:hypothetical protein
MCLGFKRNAQRVLVRKAERDHLEDICVNVRIILKWILKEYNKRIGVKKWKNLMDTEMNFDFHKMRRHSLLQKGTLGSKEGLRSVRLV